MTKKDYERLAEAFQEAKPQGDDAVWSACVNTVAKQLRADNFRFVPGRFLAACQPGANVRARHGY